MLMPKNNNTLSKSAIPRTLAIEFFSNKISPNSTSFISKKNTVEMQIYDEVDVAYEIIRSLGELCIVSFDYKTNEKNQTLLEVDADLREMTLAIYEAVSKAGVSGLSLEQIKVCLL